MRRIIEAVKRCRKLPQRLLGITLIAISIIVIKVIIAFSATAGQPQDSTALLFTIPLGIYLLTTKAQL